jgi:hypothetical protein
MKRLVTGGGGFIGSNFVARTAAGECRNYYERQYGARLSSGTSTPLVSLATAT